jgi:hypothetical protein
LSKVCAALKKQTEARRAKSYRELRGEIHGSFASYNLQVHNNTVKKYSRQNFFAATKNVKLIRKNKFPAKVLLWLAVSESGKSEPVYFKSSLAVNKEVYISKCLPVLHKFIQKHDKNEKNDLVPAHYAKDTLVRLEELKIEYIPNEENPQNVPQIRPVENSRANLKRKVCRNNYRPKDVKYLMAKIKKELKSIETTGICKAKQELRAKAQKAHLS